MAVYGLTVGDVLDVHRGYKTIGRGRIETIIRILPKFSPFAIVYAECEVKFNLDEGVFIREVVIPLCDGTPIERPFILEE